MNAKKKPPGQALVYFAWKDGKEGPEVPLPKYDVTELDDEVLRSFDEKPRLRLPNHLPYIREVCEGGIEGKRIVVSVEGDRRTAIALDDDIRRELARHGAKPLPAHRHKIISGLMYPR